MADYNPKSVVKKYRLCLFGIFFVFVAIAIVLLIFTKSTLLYGLFLIFTILPIKILSGILYNKFFSTILLNELDLPKYIDVIKTANIVSNSLLEHLYIAYYSGDYNKAINICKIKLNDSKFAKIKHYYLLILARSYFEIGDFEGLRDVNEMFKNFVASNKNYNKIKEKLIYFKFVDLYLSGDFIAAKELYEKLCLKANEKPGKDKLNDISLKFTLAICYYKCGDLSKSTDLFKDIIATAPLLNYAEISKKHLNAMENDVEYLPEQIIINTDISDLPKPKSRKKIKIIFAICLTAVTVGMIATAIGSMMAPKQPIHFKGLDYYSTQSDVKKLYGKPDEVLEFEYFKGQYYDLYYVDYLNMDATLQFIYYYDSDVLYSARLTIDSTKFDSYEDYKTATKTTYTYFSNTLSEYRVEDKSEDNEKDITWYNDKGGYSYSMVELELTFSKENNDIRECTVFKFTKYDD